MFELKVNNLGMGGTDTGSLEIKANTVLMQSEGLLIFFLNRDEEVNSKRKSIDNQ